MAIFFINSNKNEKKGDIDTIKEKFSCEATLFITWRESVDMFPNGSSEDTESYFWDSKSLWDPQLCKLNNCNHPHFVFCIIKLSKNVIKMLITRLGKS